MRISAPATLLDSNLLLRFAEPTHPLNPLARQAIRRIRGRGEAVWVCPQNFIEFWAVATRPVSANGFGYTITEAEAELARLESLFPMLPDDVAIYPAWRQLVTQANVSGKPTHDARLMAVAQVHGISSLLTFNGRDFTRFASLTPTVQITDPNTV